MSENACRALPAFLLLAAATCVTPPQPKQTCDQLVECYLACDWDKACNDACYEDAGDEAAVDWDVFDTCAGKAGCDRANPLSYFNCAFQNCPDELQACLPSGKEGCAAVSQCVTACKKDTACQAGCLAQATFAAQKRYFSVVECVVTNCPAEILEVACQGVKCRSEVEACLAAP